MADEYRTYRIELKNLVDTKTGKTVVVPVMLWRQKSSIFRGDDLKRYRECCEATAKEF